MRERLCFYKTPNLWHHILMSIRLRLTLSYTTILAVTLILFSAALRYLLISSNLSGIDRELKTVSERLAQSTQMVPDFNFWERTLEVPRLDAYSTSGLYIQVYGRDAARIVYRSPLLGEASLPLDPSATTAAWNGASGFQTRTLGDSRVRIYNAPLVRDERVVGIIQAAISLAQLDQTQRQLMIILIAGNLIAIALSAGLGALLARTALAPIDDITRTALAISRAEDLSRRLAEGPGPQDEVSRLASTFNEMLSRLESLFHTQRRFIADVSHELRTPLTTIQGNVGLLCRGAADDPASRQETVDAIESEVARMSRLVSDLLLLAQADAGVQLKAEPVELDTLLLDVYRQARLMARSVEIGLGHEDQAVVMGDPDRLRQLLLNLVDNALKYTTGGGRVTLSLERDDDWVRVAVADTGIGIPPEALEPGPNGMPLIFERFYRVDKARSRARENAGLGLSIAHWIAAAHGGRIEVESQVGHGSTFTVWLPTIKT
ncbi:MAG: HAMP domain-containing protein [Anaerolineae bacterium]|nr:HAMP domain-containing protein [Anaerolineae bacterium]